MQEFVFGDPGAGKTSYVVARMRDEELKFFNPRYKACVNYLTNRGEAYGIEYNLPPERHTVFANFDIVRKFPYMKSYDMSGFEFGVPNEFCPTRALLPFGTYIFDEAQMYWPSSEQPVPWAVRAFQLRRHIHLNIFLMAQRFTDLHAKIRDISDVYTKIIRSEHTYLVGKKKIKTSDLLPYGKLLQTTFYGRQFYSSRDAEHWNENADSERGKPFEYTFYGNVFKHYDSHKYAVNFENEVAQKYFYYRMEEKFVDERPKEWDEWKKKQQKKKKEDLNNAA